MRQTGSSTPSPIDRRAAPRARLPELDGLIEATRRRCPLLCIATPPADRSTWTTADVRPSGLRTRRVSDEPLLDRLPLCTAGEQLPKVKRSDRKVTASSFHSRGPSALPRPTRARPTRRMLSTCRNADRWSEPRRAEVRQRNYDGRDEQFRDHQGGPGDDSFVGETTAAIPNIFDGGGGTVDYSAATHAISLDFRGDRCRHRHRHADQHRKSEDGRWHQFVHCPPAHDAWSAKASTRSTASATTRTDARAGRGSSATRFSRSTSRNFRPARASPNRPEPRRSADPGLDQSLPRYEEGADHG